MRACIHDYKHACVTDRVTEHNHLTFVVVPAGQARRGLLLILCTNMCKQLIVGLMHWVMPHHTLSQTQAPAYTHRRLDLTWL